MGRRWFLATAATLIILCLAGGYVAFLLHRPVRAYIPNFRSNSVSVIDTNNRLVVETISVGRMPRGVAASPDGREVYVTSQLSDTVSVIRTADNKVVATIPVDEGPYGVAVSPEGKEIYVTQAGHFPMYRTTVSVIDVQAREVVGKIAVGNKPIGVTVSPDGKRLYVANMVPVDLDNEKSSSLSVVDVKARSTLKTVPFDEEMAAGVALSPDGAFVYVTHQTPQGIVRVLRASDLETVTKVPLGEGPFGIAVSPDGAYLYVTNLGNLNAGETVSVIRTQDYTVVDTIKVGKLPVGVAFSPDGKEVYVACRGINAVSVIDTATHQVKLIGGVGEEPWAFGSFFAQVPAW